MAATIADITVNPEGLWLLQALLGIDRLAPELRSRPYGEPRDHKDWATKHPGVAILADQDICDEDGSVNPDIAGRMAVLAVPDVEVIILASHRALIWAPQVSLDDAATWRAMPEHQLRIVLARRDGRWVSAARAGADITINDCGDAISHEWLAARTVDVLDSIHPVGPAKFSPVNVPVDDIKDAAAQRLQETTSVARSQPLLALGLRGTVLAELQAALDDPCAEAVVYARAYADTAVLASESVLDVRDTETGRMAVYTLPPGVGSRHWLTIGPATPGHMAHGVRTVLDSVAVKSWETHRRLAS